MDIAVDGTATAVSMTKDEVNTYLLETVTGRIQRDVSLSGYKFLDYDYRIANIHDKVLSGLPQISVKLGFVDESSLAMSVRKAIASATSHLHGNIKKIYYSRACDVLGSSILNVIFVPILTSEGWFMLCLNQYLVSTSLIAELMSGDYKVFPLQKFLAFMPHSMRDSPLVRLYALQVMNHYGYKADGTLDQ